MPNMMCMRERNGNEEWRMRKNGKRQADTQRGDCQRE